MISVKEVRKILAGSEKAQAAEMDKIEVAIKAAAILGKKQCGFEVSTEEWIPVFRQALEDAGFEFRQLSSLSVEISW